MDWNEVSTFVKVIEAGGFSAAAEQLELPKSTISRRVARLEERLGVRLLERTTRRMRLTEAGQAYFDQVAGPIASLMRATQAAEERQDEPRGLLRVTAPVDIGVAVLGELVKEFTARFPEVDVHVELTSRIVDLIREGFDVALRAGELEDSSLVARRLGTTDMIVVGSAAYLREHAAPRSPAELVTHPFVGHSAVLAGGRLHLRHEPDGAPATVEIGARVHTNDFVFVRRVLLAGAGLGLLPRTTAREDLASGALVRVLPSWTRPGGGLHLVYPSARFMPAKTRAFCDFVIEHRRLLDEATPK